MVLKTIGLAVDGGRFEMSQRLIDHNESKKAAAMVSGASSPEDLKREVAGMPLRDLRSQLATRGLVTSGSRVQLEQRMYEALFDELPVRWRK